MHSALMLRLGLAMALVVAVLLLHPEGALIFLGPPVVAILSKGATMTRRATAFAIGFLVALVTTFCLTFAIGLVMDLPEAWQANGSSLILIANFVIPVYVTYECLRVRLSRSLPSML
jgi:Na+-transporting NADH:ubiquinone oxidoreductase subunit NqrD